MAYGYKRGGFRRNFPRQMHKITCSECGKEAEVPFKPSNDRPVYCRDCFFKKKGITPRKKSEESEEVEEEAEEVEEETVSKKKGTTHRKKSEEVEEEAEEVEEESEESEDTDEE